MTIARGHDASYRAVFIVRPSLLAACSINGWLDAGHRVSAVWSSAPLARPGLIERLGRPERSLHAVLARAGVEPRVCAKPADQILIAEALRQDPPDVVIVAGFPQRLREHILSAVPGRCVNLHPALLPHYRGPHPTEAMFLDDALHVHGGTTLHVMDAAFDTGAIIATEPARHPPTASPERYRLAAARAAASLVRVALPAYLDGRLTPRPQDESQASYRRVSEQERTVTPAMTVARIERLARELPLLSWLAVDTPSGRIRLSGILRSSGATGRPLLVTRFTVSFDCANGRVTLRRYDRLSRVTLDARKRWQKLLMAVS